METWDKRIARRRADPQARSQVNEALRKESQRVLEDKEQLEDKLRELPQMRQEGIVAKASAEDIACYTQARSRTCGMCQHFNLKEGQKEMVRQRFPERLVLDESWAIRHLGAPLDHAGLCDASGGQMVTTTVADAGSCSGFKPRLRLFR